MSKQEDTIPVVIMSLAKSIRYAKRLTANPTNDDMETDSPTVKGSKDASLIIIDINDIDHKTFPYFLEYLYTDAIKKLSLPGAVSYQYYLKDVVHADHASELLILCYNMKSELLKSTTCDFIANNLGNIMKTTVIFLIRFIMLYARINKQSSEYKGNIEQNVDNKTCRGNARRLNIYRIKVY
ncbi:unnamed protein product [Rotaria sp. Silwood2]|nr:unnamed protein product [Rotaria sp. Silwood2]CAF4533873.1 unnamed protein product [Rotaria sp. Silwood2]